MNNQMIKLFEKEIDVSFNMKFSAEKNLLQEEIFKIFSNDSLIIEWFQHLEFFQIRWFIENLYLYNVNELLEGQIGYSIDSNTNKPIPSWNKNWLVIGYASSDPIIYNLKTKKIYSSIHGTGNWNLILISKNFEEFLTLLNLWITTISNKNIIYNEYGDIKESILNEFKKLINDAHLDKNLYEHFIKLDWVY